MHNADTTSTNITFPKNCRAVVDVTQAPYHCDPTGREDCTEALIRALDDVIRPWRDALKQEKAYFEENPFEYEGLFEARQRYGLIFHVVPPQPKILYFPNGTYLVRDTLRYTFEDLQNANNFELPQLIQFRGESQGGAVIKLADRSAGFEAGAQRPVIDIIELPASLKRLNFMKCDLAAGDKLRFMHGKGAFRVAEDAEDPIIIEDLFAMEKWRGGMALVEHASTRTLVMSDIHMHFCAAYRNSVSGGKVFIDNVFAMNQFRPEIPVFDFKGQQVWARQINPERNNPEIRNDGGSVWVFGFKSEHSGTVFHTLNGGSTEVLGGTMNQLVKADGDSPPAIVNDNSKVSVVCGTTDWRDISFRRKTIVEETRGDHTRILRWDSFPTRDGRLAAVPLYVGRAE